MRRTFKKVDYDQALDLTVRLGDCLPPEHLARFVVDSVALLDLSALYAHYGSRGGEPYAPEVLLGLLLYGYATGVFSSRKIERATYEAVPFRFIAGNLHPDHDTLATFRRTFLPELKDLFVQVLLLAQEAGVLKLGTISLDGTKVHADASRHNAVSYKRLRELETQLRAEVEELFALSEQSDQRRDARWAGGARGDGAARGPPGAAGGGQSGAAKLVPQSARQPSRPSMRPRWRSARSGSARRGADRVAAHRPRRCQGLVTATSTTSVRQALTFRHYLKQHTKRFVGKVQSSPKADGYGRSCQKKQLVVKKLLGQCGRQRKAISFEAVC